MKPEEQVKADFEKAGLLLGEDQIKRLIPMCQRWQNFIKEAREIEVGDVDPALFSVPSAGEKASKR
jgi:hypothetical protein